MLFSLSYKAFWYLGAVKSERDKKAWRSVSKLKSAILQGNSACCTALQLQREQHLLTLFKTQSRLMHYIPLFNRIC